MNNFLSLLSGILVIIAFVPYIGATLRDRKLAPGSSGKTEPSKVTWLIWASLDTITLVGMHLADSVNGQIVGAVLGAWFVTVLAFFYGSSAWDKLDFFCVGGALVGILLMFAKPEYGIIASLSTVFIGSFPTFANTWKDPAKENKLAWTIFLISGIVAVLAIPKWTIADSAQPLIFLIIETVMVIIIYLRPRYIQLAKARGAMAAFLSQ